MEDIVRNNLFALSSTRMNNIQELSKTVEKSDINYYTDWAGL